MDTLIRDRGGMMARRLAAADLPEVLEISRAQAEVMRRSKPVSYDRAFEATLRTTYLTGDDRGALFGAFADGQLHAYLSIYCWREFPYFTVGNLKTRPGCVNMLSAGLNAFGACAAAALDYTEQRGLFRGYMLHATDRWPSARVRRSLSQSLPGVERYHYEIELVVPRGTQPAYGFAWTLMGKQTWLQDLAIETLTLKQEYRPVPTTAVSS